MSLQTAAEAVRQQGRGEDTMLVHMTPGEVKGLQQLAVANGGSLTINPETGLAEAGFLKSLLPTLIGAGLTVFSGGAINPLTAGFMVGGLEAARTGDIGRGLMAGLGAYGGAGLGSAASSAGAAASDAAAKQTAMQSLGTTGGAGFAGSGAATDAAIQQEIARQGLAAAPTTAMGQLSQAGTGIGNILGTTGTTATQEAARAAGMEALGGSATSAAMKTGSAFIEPLTAVPPAPEIAQPEYNYDGPYVPSERNVRFPTDRDPADSSEFQYFDVVNPTPGFQPMASSAPLPQNTYGPDAPRFAGIPVEMATDPERMRDYQANPNLYSFAEGGAAGVSAPPADYVPGQNVEFDYGFRPMAAQVPEIQQQAAKENALVQARIGNDGGGSDYYGPGVPFNQVNNQLPQEARSNLVDRIAAMNMAQQQRAAAAAAIASGASPSNDFSGNEGGGGFMSTSEGHSMGAAANPDRNDGGYGLRAGGELAMDDGGFIIDAHTVSEIGNGSSDAGHEMLAKLGGEPIKGPGDGTSDSIKANIGGVQEARVAKDESYLSRDEVKALGGGNLKKGEKMLYKLMAEAHKSRKQKGRGQATGLDKLIARMA